MGGGQPYLYTSTPELFNGDSLPSTFNPKAVTMASLLPPPPPKPKPKGPLINFNRHPDSYLILPYGHTNARPMSPKTKNLIKWARWLQLFLRALQLLGAIGVLLCGIFIKGTQNSEGFIIRIPPGVDIGAALYAIYHLLRAAGGRPAGSSASYHFFALVLDAGFIPFYVFTALLSNRNYNQPPGTRGRWRTFFPTEEETTTVLHSAWLAATATAGLHCASLFLDLYLVLVFRKITKLPPDMNPLEDNLTSRRKTKHKHKNSSISAMTPLTADEKRFSAASASTTDTGNRESQAEPLIEKGNLNFMHTRTNSDVAYSPHTPNSARHSRQSMYSQSNSARASRADLHTREDLHRTKTNDSETLSQRKMKLAAKAIKRSSRPNSMISTKQENSGSPRKAKMDTTDVNDGDIALQNPLSDSLDSDNWFVHNDSGHKDPGYGPISASDSEDEQDASEMYPQPLRMNPPTPPRALTPNSLNPSPPKSRYYGDLASATQGIRRSPSPTKASISPTKSLAPTSFASVRRIGDAGYTAVRAQSPRVVSRTGVDYGVEESWGRRDVSGKVAEEGRGGGFGLRGRRVSGMA